jgi:hypothetical protein
MLHVLADLGRGRSGTARSFGCQVELFITIA